MKQTIIDMSGRQLAIASQIELTCTVKGHNKFWSATVAFHENPSSGTEKNKPWIVILTWGRIGTVGQKLENRFVREHAAQSYLWGRKRDKIVKGYVETKTSFGAGTLRKDAEIKVETPALNFSTEWDLF